MAFQFDTNNTTQDQGGGYFGNSNISGFGGFPNYQALQDYLMQQGPTQNPIDGQSGYTLPNGQQIMANWNAAAQPDENGYMAPGTATGPTLKGIQTGADSSGNYQYIGSNPDGSFTQSKNFATDSGLDPVLAAMVLGATGVGAWASGGLAGIGLAGPGAEASTTAGATAGSSGGGLLGGGAGSFSVPEGTAITDGTGFTTGSSFLPTSAAVPGGAAGTSGLTAAEGTTAAGGAAGGGAAFTGGSSAASMFAPEAAGGTGLLGSGFSGVGAEGLAVDGTGLAGASGGLAGGGAGMAATAAGSGATAAGTSLSDILSGGKTLAGLAGGLLGGAGVTGMPKALTNTVQNNMDPRMQALLYGDGTAANPGILNNIAKAGANPQTAGTSSFGQGIDNYLGQSGAQNFIQSQQAAQKLQGSSIATPQMTAAQSSMTPSMQAATSQAAQVNAPSQNNLDLSGAYSNMINGNAGANPYLTSALQSAVNQTNASYQQNQTNLTNNLQRNILPGIGDAAQFAGQYGGSRQGIAQGNAISDYTNQLNNSNLQLGLANSANTTGQQATAYNQGQDRSLSALNTLSGNQYGTATTNAQLQQQTNIANAANQQAANTTNYAGQQQTNIANSGYQNTANTNNLQAGLTTNALNSTNQIAGTQLSGGLLNNANTYGQANNNYDLTRAGTTASDLSSFTGLGNSTVNSTPLNTSTAGNILGGISTGIGLYNGLNNATQSGGLLSSLFS